MTKLNKYPPYFKIIKITLKVLTSLGSMWLYQSNDTKPKYTGFGRRTYK
jgi:hypothetical protein